MKIQLQRQGVAESVNCVAPSGMFIEISYHYGHGSWCVRTAGKDAWYPYQWLVAANLADAIRETEGLLRCEFNPEIEAYCYSNAATLKAHPNVAKDVYITAATYEPETNTIRHEPTNICLIVFDHMDPPFPWGRALRFPRDGANLKWIKEIAKAAASYNSNVGAHGKGDEQKEWLAWLVGEYIKEMPGEKPVRVQSIRRGKTYPFQYARRGD